MKQSIKNRSPFDEYQQKSQNKRSVEETQKRRIQEKFDTERDQETAFPRNFMLSEERDILDNDILTQDA